MPVFWFRRTERPAPADSAALPRETGQQTQLGQTLAEQLSEHPGESGLHPLNDPLDAFAARYLLAHAAERTLDVQYYIWGNDLTGALMLSALLEAANRGVRVRLLLDDNGIQGLDDRLAALDSHENIEVRLFNPFALRWPRWVNYLTDFRRINRRMHNKSFTADSQATVVGGRNIADEYFAAGTGLLFADLDVIAVGRVIEDVAADFDRYWNSESAWPIENLIEPTENDPIGYLRLEARQFEQDERTIAYLDKFEHSAFIEAFLDGRLEMFWGRAELVSDDPHKILDKPGSKGPLSEQLREAVGLPTDRIYVVSPYFVPTRSGAKLFTELAESGVEVVVLTNSLEATDVAAVHSGYSRYRKRLLKAGVKLYEMQRLSGQERMRGKGPLGSSGSSLHAKTFAVDGKRVFVGSFNFDPRSAQLNTEMGLLIDSPELAGQLAETFAGEVPQYAYSVHLDGHGGLYWIERTESGKVRHEHEPHTSAWKRMGVAILARLPIVWLL
ncbi:phospholipase D family protein [Wenzhouxiangella sp. XN201]|uniref:phospholipase D family protein n=1 Tax=Wenzhouxiangella sp. XN201 TaxID=2710755 RepID=UPI0013CA8997|nr:phospholipase D family protein [Wenzhouxiangella sp. XN201]NEZ04318.1 phospholipase D family protein [Wenzhouxiangella sp. XN201]